MKILGGIFDLEKVENDIKKLEEQTFEVDFWNRKDSQDILKEITNLKKIKDEYIYLNSMYEEIQMILEFIEMGDNSFESDLEEKINILENEINNFKIKVL